MEISKDKIQASLALAENSKLFEELNDIYSSIPSGECEGCTKCCMESVNTFYIEFLNIYRYVSNIDGFTEKWIKHIEDHYFNELIEKKACPFLDEVGKCIIYPVRPLVCRMFGYATKEEHESNYEQVYEMNNDADEYFYEEYGVHLSKEVVNHKIEFCKSFKSGRKITLKERQGMIDKMFKLDSQFLMEDLIPEDAINISLTNWFIYTRYTEEVASGKRIKKLLNNKNK